MHRRHPGGTGLPLHPVRPAEARHPGEAAVELLAPIQARYHELIADRGELQALLRTGAGKARAVAAATLARAQAAVGMLPA